MRASEEAWIEVGRTVNYRTSSRLRRSGSQITLEIEYRESANPDLAGEDGCWGVSKLDFSPGEFTGLATWHEHGETGRPTRGRWWAVPLVGVRKRVQLTRAERQQARFREELRSFGERCAVTGEEMPEALEAAHLLSVERGGPDVPQNGIFLRADLHRLLDANFFTIDPTGKLHIVKPLASAYEQLIRKKERLDDAVLQRIHPFLRLR